MKNILFYTILIGIAGLGAVDLGLDIYLKFQSITSNSEPISTENIANFEIIDDI